MNQFVQFIQNHWQLGVAFVVISILIGINELLNIRNLGKSISPEEAVNLINNSNATVIDLRDPATFKSGHIIGAIRAVEADFATPRKYKKPDIISSIVYFESLPENAEIVNNRHKLWSYITELLQDPKMKKYVIW